MLDLPVSSTAAALDLFAQRVAVFVDGYAQAVDAALQRGLPTTVCTIYNADFEPRMAQRVRMALAMYNDVILRAALSRSLPVIHLGLVCTEPGDYFNPIEPSAAGGRKIARMIAASLQPAEHPQLQSRVHGRLPPER
jgi:hypothetical protein